LVGTLSLKVDQHKIDVETRSKDNVFIRVSLAVQVKVAQNQKEFAQYQGNYGKKYSQAKKGKKSKVDLNETGDDQGEGAVLMGPLPESDDGILYNAYYRLENPVQQILSYMEEYFRFHGMEYTLDEMFAARNDMTHELQQMLNYKMNPFGWIICNILVLDIDPDPKVKQAMNDIITCEKEKRAQQSRAEADKLTKILAAEAEARTRELAGEGIANARKAILQGLQESVENFKHALPDSDPNQILKTVLMTQYMDTIKEASLTGRNTFVMPSSPAQVLAIEDQIRHAIGVPPHNSRVVM
jgi:regulator of protease activity HflC (stomatin/prohibitin superfamily)